MRRMHDNGLGHGVAPPMVRASGCCLTAGAVSLSDTCIISCFVLTFQCIWLKIRIMPYIDLFRLKELRERRGLTQEELATLSGVSRPTIAALELGYRRAYSTTTRKLAKALKVKPEALGQR